MREARLDSRRGACSGIFSTVRDKQRREEIAQPIGKRREKVTRSLGESTKKVQGSPSYDKKGVYLTQLGIQEWFNSYNGPLAFT